MGLMKAIIAALAGLALMGGAACSRKEPGADPAAQRVAFAAAKPGSLDWAVTGPWRLEPQRDRYRHPAATLAFFGLAPEMTVVEAYPGRGWYTAIIAPYLARGGGRLYAASFDPITANEAQAETLAAFKGRFLGDPKTFGKVEVTILSPTAPGVAPDGAADMVLVFRNLHTLMAEGFARKAFDDFYKALKPGGILGIEQHRAKSSGLQDPQADNGYVQTAFVKALAAEAGFEFVAESEINANRKDTKDHPFGVWTLPPTLRTSPLGKPDDPRFDTAKYEAIGESDRMTLKFRKPLATGKPAPGKKP